MMSLFRRSIQQALRGPLLAVWAATVLMGCRDAEGNPVALILPDEAGGALALDAELPTLPDLAAQAGVTVELRRAVDLWEASWTTADAVEGPGLRAEAYRSAAPELARVLGLTEARRLSTTLQAALTAISSAGAVSPDPWIASEVERAGELHVRVQAALEDGDVAMALSYAMEASDALRRFSPSRAVETFLAKADTELTAGDDALSDADRARAIRLVEGARSAIAEGDWHRAIQRAYYASQLLAR
jgi:hypothetical protein